MNNFLKLFLLLLFTSSVASAQTTIIAQDSICIDGDNVSIQLTKIDSAFYLSSSLNDTSFGLIYIGNGAADAANSMKYILYFLTNKDLDFLCFHTSDLSYIKLARESEDEPSYHDDYPPFITDGTENYSELSTNVIWMGLLSLHAAY